MSKKYLTKNEFRIDLNPEHRGKNNEQHPAYITLRQGHRFRANNVTHSRYIKLDDNVDVNTFDIIENPNKLSKDKRQTRISPPYWQNDKLFSENTLDNFRFSNQTRKKIKKVNKKFK